MSIMELAELAVVADEAGMSDLVLQIELILLKRLALEEL